MARGGPTGGRKKVVRATSRASAKQSASTKPVDPSAVIADEPDHYAMRISRLTIDKLGVKLYDKVSAVVAELVANAYDADAGQVTVDVPLGTELATHKNGVITDSGLSIVVTDDGHGLTPLEAQRYFLVVGTDRRTRPGDGARSRGKKRAVMGRKGIGKLAPFGICRRIEVLSAGGPKTSKGYRVSHFILDFDRIVADVEVDVDIEAGDQDKTWASQPGTRVTLSDFLPKRVPVADVFIRQIARRFALTAPDFNITVHDTRQDEEHAVGKFEIPLNEATRVDVDDKPVRLSDTEFLPVRGWLAFARDAYKDEEMAGVRIYARGKIVATTRDFEQPAGFTGEFATRSYLVGEVHAEWLDEEEDLVRTDRQGILWDSERGEALRAWGMSLIKQIARKSAGPRRESKAKVFLERAKLQERARERYGDDTVVEAVVNLGRQIGAFASEDELADDDYVNDLADVVLAVGPHQALIAAFKTISDQEDKDVEDLLKRPGLHGGSDSTGEWDSASTEEVPQRAA